MGSEGKESRMSLKFLMCSAQWMVMVQTITIFWHVNTSRLRWLEKDQVGEEGQEFSLVIWLWLCKVLEKAMAPHSSTLAWRIPGMGEPGGLPSTGSHRVGHDWSDLAATTVKLKYFPFMKTSIVHINKYSLLNQCILRQDSPSWKKGQQCKIKG